MGFAEDFSHMRIPLDSNSNPASALVVVDPGTGVFAPVSAALLPDGSYAVKIVSAGALAVPAADTITPIAVSDVATILLAANPLRKGHILFNAGSSTMYIGVNAAITTSTAVPVAAGASFNLDVPGTVYTGAIYGLCTTGESTEARGISYHD